MVVFYIMVVDDVNISWHQVILEYLELIAIAKDFEANIGNSDSFFYPLGSAYNTIRYRKDVPSYLIPPDKQ